MNALERLEARRSITNALNELDSYADKPGGIAGFLLSLNIKGTMCDSRRCPVAEFVKLRTSIIVSLFETVSICNSSGWIIEDLDEELKVPDRVFEFIGDFDDDRYPKLIDKKRPMNPAGF